jgi:acetyl esterase/lipase
MHRPENSFGVFVCIAGFVAFGGGAQSQTLTPTVSNVAYGPGALETLDYYAAPGPGLHPVVIEMHPGGWAGGAKSQFQPYGELFDKINARGIAIVSINYPLAPQATFPAPNLSAQRAVQFVRLKAQEWGLDPNSVAVTGNSAGGNLAAWVAMSPDAADWSSTDAVKQQSSRPNALMVFMTPTDITNDVYKYSGLGHGISPVWVFFGVSTQAQYDAIPNATKLAASPRWLVANSGATAQNAQIPFLGVYLGAPFLTKSSQVPMPDGDVHSPVQGLLMCEALRAIGNFDSSLYISLNFHPEVGAFPQSDMLADWLWLRLGKAGVRSNGMGVPGCYSTQILNTTGRATVGNANFGIRGYDSFANATGLLFLSDNRMGTDVDVYGVGLPLLVDTASPALAGYTTIAGSDGRSTLPLPIPNNPAFAGMKAYAQTAWLWPSPSQLGGCAPSPLQLSVSNLLEISVQ